MVCVPTHALELLEYAAARSALRDGRIEARRPPRLSLDVLAQSSQTTTIDKDVLVSSDVAVIASIAEPVLDIKHGVVSSSNGSVTGTSGNWTAPGTGGKPFSGNVTDLMAGAFESYKTAGGNKGVKSDISCACHWAVNQASAAARVSHR